MNPNDNQGKKESQIRDSENITFFAMIGLILTMVIAGIINYFSKL